MRAGAALAVVLAVVAAVWLLPDRGRNPAPPTPPSGPGGGALLPPASSPAEWDARIAGSDTEGFPALFDEAAALADDAGREQLLARLVAAWLQADAHGLMRHFMRLEVAGDRPRLDLLAGALMEGLTGLDERLAASDAIRELIRRLVLHLARTDPETALAWANRWLLGDTRDAAFVEIARGLARADLSGALELAESIGSPLRRMQALAVVGGVWARTDLGASVDWASRRVPPTERALALNAALLAGAGANPVEAAQALAAAERTLAEEHRATLGAALAALNLTEADLANDPESYREKLAEGVLPPATSPDVELLGEAARAISRHWAGFDADAALRWAQALESDYLRVRAAKGGLTTLSLSDPATAVSRFLAGYGEHADILAAIYETWTGRDAAGAAGASLELSDPVHRRTALQAVTAAWAPAAPIEAARWVDALPVSEKSDALVLTAVEGLASDHPAESWRRALQVADPSLRTRALRVAFSSYATAAPEEARRALSSTALPPALKERLEEMLANFDG